MQARALAALVVCGFLALGAVSASGQPRRGAGSVHGADPAGDVAAANLTPAERAAIDIVSVDAIGKEGLGVLVTVTFKGNFAAMVGRGNLKNAAAVLILRGAAEGSSAGVVTLGAGQIGTILRHTRSTDVAAARAARQLTFLVSGPGYGSVVSVTAEVVLNAPPLGARRTAAVATADPPHISDVDWQKLLAASAADEASVSDPMRDALIRFELGKLLAMVTRSVLGLEKTEIALGPDPILVGQIDDFNALALLIRYELIKRTLGLMPLSATLSAEAGGLVVVAKNAGSDPFDALRIGLLGMVHHTGARLITGPGSCGPGVGPSDVLCTLGKPLAPGASATISISTDKAYDLAKGVNLFGRVAGQSDFKGPFASAGPSTACECLDLSVEAGVAHGNVVNPQGPVHLSLIMNWTMSCSGGAGACAGRISVVPPGDLKVTSPPGATAACAGKPGCPGKSTGRFVVRMTSAADLHKENHNVPIAVKIFCKSGAAFVQVRTAELVLHFGAHALLDARHSDLRA